MTVMEESGEIKQQRIFLGNLPKDVKLTHLFSVLPPGYDKSQVDIKHNYDIDKNVTSSYAFVNIEGTSSELKAWCDTASKKSLGGSTISVQFAKLSFLERLKQEVDSQRVDKGNVANNTSVTHKLLLFNQDSSSSESYEAEEDSSSLTFPPSPGGNSGVGGTNKSKTDSQAEVRRIESLKERSSAHLSQQKIIRMAIKQASKGPSNKILFQDSDDENSQVETNNEKNKKRKLFDDSDSGDEEEDAFFTESKPKSKLIRTKISAIDERFRMDSKFFDEDNEVKEKNEDDTSEEEQGKLLQIVDAIIEKDPQAKHKVKNKIEFKSTMSTRFDPLQKNHSSLVIKTDEDIELQIKKPVQPKPFKVTQDRFYEFSEDLREQFNKNEKSSFSLLSMFGGSTDAPLDDKGQIGVTNEDKATDITHFKTPLTVGVPNFFNIDEDPENEGDELVSSKPSTKSAKKSWREPLFLNLEDPRIEEALDFFSSPPEDSLPYNVIRSHLKKIVKKKHRKNIAKAKEFKTKLGNRRKFQRSKDKKKTDVKSSIK